MNPFDLKAALLAKHMQHPVINPHTHGVVHGSNVWLANSKLPPIAGVCEKWRHHLSWQRVVIF